MPFSQYLRTDGKVKACQLTVDTEQDIADALSMASTMGGLASLTATRSAETNCMEYSFRYRDTSATVTLKNTDWLVQQPTGRYEIVNNATFIERYYNGEVDYIFNPLNEETVKSFFLKFVNNTFPELYTNNMVPSLSPYETLPASSVATNSLFTARIESGAVIATAADSNAVGSSMVGAEVTINYAAAAKATAYSIGMNSNVYNAPVAWTVDAVDAAGLISQVSKVTEDQVKTGVYKIETPRAAVKLIFTFQKFAVADTSFADLRIVTFNGGEIVAPDTPVPLTKLSHDIMEVVAEKLITWYDPATDVYTMDFSTGGITDLTGLARIYRHLMNASFITDNTKVILNFSNSIGQAEITDITLQVGFDLGTDYAGSVPNQINAIGLQQFLFQMKCLDQTNAYRLKEINFAPSKPGAMSAIAKSVTYNSNKLWDDFVEQVINTTGLNQPGQIKK